MFDPETRKAKEGALRTLLTLDGMTVPEARLDTTKMSNLSWLRRNLQINNATHPMFDTARELIRQLSRDNARKRGKSVGAMARAEATIAGYPHAGAVVQWIPGHELVEVRRDDGPDGALVCDTFDAY
jgi:hypothetical protein